MNPGDGRTVIIRGFSNEYRKKEVNNVTAPTTPG